MHELSLLGQWLTLIVAFAIFMFVYRNGGGTALSELKAANEILSKRVHNLNDEKNELIRQVAELKGRTDVAEAIIPLLTALKSHDDNMQRRSDGVMQILDLIARRLGPDHKDI